MQPERDLGNLAPGLTRLSVGRIQHKEHLQENQVGNCIIEVHGRYMTSEAEKND